MIIDLVQCKGNDSVNDGRDKNDGDDYDDDNNEYNNDDDDVLVKMVEIFPWCR